MKTSIRFSFSSLSLSSSMLVLVTLITLMINTITRTSNVPFAYAWQPLPNRSFFGKSSLGATTSEGQTNEKNSQSNSKTNVNPKAAAAANVNVESLLYQEQEKMLIERGIWEGQLMTEKATTPPVPLQAPVIKGAGTTGGFGKASSSKSSSASRKAQAKALAKELKTVGVVRVDKVLQDDTADALRQFLYQYRIESEQLVQNGTLRPIQRFADVLLRQNRCDMPVPLGSDIVNTALTQVLVHSPVGDIVSKLLTDQAVLYELSCLMSDPGSQRQVVHPDTPYLTDTDAHGDEPVLLTCFIALQDITLEMGPTTWLPYTHNSLEIHRQFQDDTTTTTTTTKSDDPQENAESPKDRLLRTTPAVLGTLPKGSCGMYDSRLLHCGGANQSTPQQNGSDNSRALFYLSFRNPRIAHGAVGNPGSIRRDLVTQWTLGELRRECQLVDRGKPSGKLVSEP